MMGAFLTNRFFSALSTVSGLLRHLPWGLRPTKEFLENRKVIWELPSNSTPEYGSSISDSSDYSTVVKEAGSADSVFAKFRSNRHYLEILDHVGYQLGTRYLNLLKQRSSYVLSGVKQLDHAFGTLGGPLTYTFFIENHGTFRVSPTLFRYLKVAADLRSLFGNLQGFVVGEIGIGYGGQALALSKLEQCTFSLFDLPEVNALAAKFLTEAQVSAPVTFVDGRNPESIQLDLVISNYAFSELRPELQENYFQKVVSLCPRGYFTWNSLSEDHLGGMRAEDFAKLIPGAEIFNEVPLSHSGNCIIVWGHAPNSSPLT